jgi:N6-L-threonylcarbamoyladenine synthase
MDKAAKGGDPNAIHFTKAKVNGSEYDFSFSGLKSACLNYINTERMAGREINIPDFAASFEHSVVGVLVEHTIRAAKEHGMKDIALAGGVAANSELRRQLEEACEANGFHFYVPSPIFCTDNAVMIGAAAYHEFKCGTRSGWNLNAVPDLKLGERAS